MFALIIGFTKTINDMARGDNPDLFQVIRDAINCTKRRA